ncbi:hypothetical protein ROS62_02115 [Streptomyces sp. DSM 41972]|uniref:Integral membrane protein n=1 Tax=Streptomyces althioticus subsp. attaecolombicae TaxID=3075534 RepID=A0ABU3HSS6_9ACTN|nr:hypothetical protein [Streptomyces sp. DSM 41972]SCD82634.1 hypothetical protein GA0115238_126927 [Streptomyces sp. di50b]SCE01053.1 hypothetical protein GA0115245_118612 [Streptomyces sp. di188]
MSTTPLTAPARTGAPLRRLLTLDAVMTGANALAHLALSGPLGRFLGIGSGLLLGLGAFLAVYAAGVGLLAARPHPPTAGVRGVVEANLAWTAASFLALALWLSPTTAGAVWVVLQALVVGGLALVQHQALKARQSSQV